MFLSQKMIKNQHKKNDDGPDWRLARRHNSGYDTTKTTNLTAAKDRDDARLHEQIFRYHEVAEACHRAYFMPLEDNSQVMVLKRGEKWFDAVMLRSFTELYRVTNDARYLDSLESSLRHACKEKRPNNKGLFTNQLLRQRPKLAGIRDSRTQSKSLLTQAAMIEMMARLSNIK